MDAEIAAHPGSFLRWPWRTGRKVGRTVYAHPPGISEEDPAYDGHLIGLFDSPDLAAAAVRAHNMTIGRTGEKS